MKNKIIIGSRGSKLALFQADYIKSLITTGFPSITAEIRTIVTTGDKILDRPLSKIGDKGLFTREIEELLISEDIDLAVHSLKDLPTELGVELEISALSVREEFRDALISASGKTLMQLKSGSVIGTSSLRRRSQLLNLRPDLKLVDLRGNVETRLRKLKDGNCDATVLAAAGLLRLSLGGVITELIEPAIMIPAAGQGIIAVETKCGRNDLSEMLDKINNSDSKYMAKAERAVLRKFEGGCRAPIGVNASLLNNEITINAFVGSLDGKVFLRDSISGNKEEAESLGIKLAEKMSGNGADDIIERSRHEFS